MRHKPYHEKMNDILLTIRGLTHSEISDEREAFLRSALGRRIWLQPASRLLDELRVEAFVGTKQVGCVASEDVSLFWQAMDAVKGGGNSGQMLKGEIVRVEDYMMVARLTVPLLENPREKAAELTKWEYSGPLMYKTREEVKLEFLTGRLSEDLSAMEEDEVTELLDAFCRLIVHDLSCEAQAFRKALRKRLGESGSEALRRASLRIEELSRRMGGNTKMGEMGQWLKNELTESDEALMMPRTCDFRGIVAEARKLPKNLFDLWHRDTAEMARVLYGMRAKREDVRRVLSCLVWIELREREYGLRYGDEKHWLNIDEMVMYCKQCVSWDDVRPIVEMMRNHLRQSGYQTSEEVEKINSIEAEFLNRRYGKTYIKEQTVIPNVGNYKPQITTQSMNLSMPPTGQGEQRLLEDE